MDLTQIWAKPETFCVKTYDKWDPDCRTYKPQISTAVKNE